jgi:glycerol-3-phosphate O-acyltransferase/dihydroxyacetone phosphate acyltransferase
MALGALARNPDCGVKIVPCGMNYFHAHKFRSRAVIEFGNPIEVPPELVQMYKSGQRREAVGSLLDTIYQGLVAVTVTSPDYETLMVIQAARRLYNPTHKKLPLPMVVELNRRMVKGYSQYKDDPRIVQLKKSVLAYNKQLWLLGIRDHQVEYAKFSFIKVVATLIYRLVKLVLLAIGTLPGLVLFTPVFITTKVISIKKSREALAASTVKIQGRDVMATWKLLVALAFAPLVYAFYTAILTYWTYRNRVQGYVPEWVPLWFMVILGMVVFPTVTFAALRIGETGMDILKSLRPLVLSLNPTAANTLVKLRARRAELSRQVTELINTLGPEMFPDFDSARIVVDPFRKEPVENDFSLEPYSPITAESSADKGGAHGQADLPRNESFQELGKIGFFSTRPPSRSRSRSSSGGVGVPVQSLTALDSKESFDEVSRRIRGAMRERGRRRQSEDSGWDMASSRSSSPLVTMEDKKQV